MSEDFQKKMGRPPLNPLDKKTLITARISGRALVRLIAIQKACGYDGRGKTLSAIIETSPLFDKYVKPIALENPAKWSEEIADKTIEERKKIAGWIKSKRPAHET